jgi:putative endonuclease
MTSDGVSMSAGKQQLPLGSWGEQRAAEFLARMGMVLVTRNYRVPEGEIDLIMEDSGTLVFVEVKTRASLRFGNPEESIKKRKLARMYQAAHAYLESQEVEPIDWRFDVIAIVCSADREVRRIDHYKGIGLLEG